MVFLLLSNLLCQLSYLLLHVLGRRCLPEHAQLPLIIDIGETLALSFHIFLPLQQVISILFILSVLPAQPRLILLESLRMAHIFVKLFLHCISFGFNLRLGRLSHEYAICLFKS